jgi:hypothetical protein
VPCLNPDGYTSGSRHNSNDEDLNRGFPGWKDVGKSRFFFNILLKSWSKIFTHGTCNQVTIINLYEVIARLLENSVPYPCGVQEGVLLEVMAMTASLA